jgi:hypothetical protein
MFSADIRISAPPDQKVRYARSENVSIYLASVSDLDSDNFADIISDIANHTIVPHSVTPKPRKVFRKPFASDSRVIRAVQVFP